MTYISFGFVVGGRAWRPLAALVIGIAAATSLASAQQPAPKTIPPALSGWRKSCNTAAFVKKDAAGKDEAKQVRICLTKNEQLDSKSGKVLFSAAIRQVGGQDKQYFMVTLPLGMMLQPGIRAVLVAKDMWEKAQRNEKVDDAKLKPFTLAYTLCLPAGCDGELEATPEFISDLKTSGGLMIYAINSAGAPVGFALPLAGFEGALSQQIEETYRARIVLPKK